MINSKRVGTVVQLLACCILFSTFSCTGEASSKEEETLNSSDSIPYFAGELSLPVKIDSAFIVRNDTSERLSYTVLRAMRAEFANLENEKQLQSFINDFCRIDSLKSSGHYGKYSESLEIGMMQNASAFKLGNLKLNDKTDLLLWRLNFISYEACPYYSGTVVIGSIRRGSSYTHLPLGKIYYAGDPPGFMSETLTSELTNDWIAINTVTTTDDDMELPGDKKETRCYTVQIREMNTDSLITH